MGLITSSTHTEFMLVLGETSTSGVVDIVHIYKSGRMWIVADVSGKNSDSAIFTKES